MLTASRPRTAVKRATNVSLPEDLLSEAKALQINISQAAEAGVAQAIARARSELWLSESQEAIKSSNAFVEKQGLPLAKYRMFPMGRYDVYPNQLGPGELHVQADILQPLKLLRDFLALCSCIIANSVARRRGKVSQCRVKHSACPVLNTMARLSSVHRGSRRSEL